jgi:hypothetical protein
MKPFNYSTTSKTNKSCIYRRWRQPKSPATCRIHCSSIGWTAAITHAHVPVRRPSHPHPILPYRVRECSRLVMLPACCWNGRLQEAAIPVVVFRTIYQARRRRGGDRRWDLCFPAGCDLGRLGIYGGERTHARRGHRRIGAGRAATSPAPTRARY